MFPDNLFVDPIRYQRCSYRAAIRFVVPEVRVQCPVRPYSVIATVDQMLLSA